MTKRSFKNKDNVISPKVEHGKMLLDRTDSDHAYIYDEIETTKSDWDKLANIAEKVMEVNDFTIDDVRNDLKEHRKINDEYEDEIRIRMKEYSSKMRKYFKDKYTLEERKQLAKEIKEELGSRKL